jgi:hypothetical protein
MHLTRPRSKRGLRIPNGRVKISQSLTPCRDSMEGASVLFLELQRIREQSYLGRGLRP